MTVVPVPDGIQGIKLHPTVRKYSPTSNSRPHFEGTDEELAHIVLESLKDSTKLRPGRFQHTHVVEVAADRFRIPAVHTAVESIKPHAQIARVVVWESKALEREHDPLAAKCQLAIVKIMAA